MSSIPSNAAPRGNPDDSLAAGSFLTAAFSPDDKVVLTGDYWGNVQLWDLETGRELRRFQGHSERVRSVEFSTDGALIVTAGGRETDMSSVSSDNSARVWDVTTGRQVAQLEGHTSFIYSASFSPDARRVLTSSRDGTARLWQVETRREQLRFADLDFQRPALFSPDGLRVLGIVRRNGAQFVQVWDVAAGHDIQRLEGHAQEIQSAAFSPDGRFIVTTSRDHTARIWEVEGGRQLHVLAGHEGPVVDGSFSTDGRMLITASQDGTARLWNAQTGMEVRRFDHGGPVRHGFLARDGERLLTHWRSAEPGDATAFASLWDAKESREVRQMALRSGGTVAIMSSDGRKLLSTTPVTTLWQTKDGSVIHRYGGP